MHKTWSHNLTNYLKLTPTSLLLFKTGTFQEMHDPFILKKKYQPFVDADSFNT